jgi:hypothetical protein
MNLPKENLPSSRDVSGDGAPVLGGNIEFAEAPVRSGCRASLCHDDGHVAARRAPHAYAEALVPELFGAAVGLHTARGPAACRARHVDSRLLGLRHRSPCLSRRVDRRERQTRTTTSEN